MFLSRLIESINLIKSVFIVFRSILYRRSYLFHHEESLWRLNNLVSHTSNQFLKQHNPFGITCLPSLDQRDQMTKKARAQLAFPRGNSVRQNQVGYVSLVHHITPHVRGHMFHSANKPCFEISSFTRVMSSHQKSNLPKPNNAILAECTTLRVYVIHPHLCTRNNSA